MVIQLPRHWNNIVCKITAVLQILTYLPNYIYIKNKYKNWREHQINNCILNFQVFQVEYIKISQNYATGVHREKSTTGCFFHEQLVKLEEYENACYIPKKA